MKTPEWHDITAIIIIVGCLVLIFCGHDGDMKAILGVSAGWLFRSATKRNGATK